MAIAPLCSSGRACAHAHVRDVLPYPHPLNGNDRECPGCQGNLSVNPANSARAHILITCHGPGKCTETAAGRARIRDLLISKHQIPAACLGPFGLGGDGPAASLPRARREVGPAERAAMGRDAAYASLIAATAGYRNPTIIRMCMQRVRESDGELPGDPGQLIPPDRAGFIALARRTGIDRIQAATLAGRWFGKQVA